MKRFISFALIFMLLVSFAACRRQPSPAPSNPSRPTSLPVLPTKRPTVKPTETPGEEPTPAPTPMPETGDGEAYNELPRLYCGDNVFFIVTADGALYGWGSNDYGQMIAREGDVKRPFYMGSGLTPIMAGDSVFALDTEHTLFGWGRNDKAQLGQGDLKNRNIPTRILENVEQLVYRFGSYYARTDNGEIYKWGLTDYLELTEDEKAALTAPRKIFDGAVWFDENFIITENNELLVFFGDDSTEKLEDDADRVWGDGTAIAVRNTAGTLCALTDDGRVELSGDFRDVRVCDGTIWFINDHGELYRYIANRSSFMAETGRVGELELVMNEVVAFDAGIYVDEDLGYDYKFALKYNGELWSWGNYDDPILGRAEGGDPTVPECAATNVTSFTCNGLQTYIITEDGAVWTTGRASDDYVHGSLGDGTTASRRGFTRIGLEGAMLIYAELDIEYVYEEDIDGVELYCRTFAVDTNGTIYAWGWNGDGLLGTGSEAEDVLSPEEIHFTK